MGKIFGFQRWQHSPEVTNLTAELRKTAELYFRHAASSRADDKALARKFWQKLEEGYWTLLFALIDAQTESFPNKLVFDASERLFIDFGYMDEALTPKNAKFDLQEALNSKPVTGIFPYGMFSDFIAESWAMITAQRYSPPPYAAIEERLSSMRARLRELQAQRNAEFLSIAGRNPETSSAEAEKITAVMGQYLLNACKVELRVKQSREAPEQLQQGLTQERFRYAEAEKAMHRILSESQKAPEAPLPSAEADRFLALHESTKVLTKKIIYVQQDEEKAARRAKRVHDACAQFSEQMMRRELKNVLLKKKEYMAVPAKTARCETSLLCPQAFAPIPCERASRELEALCDLDMGMFAVARVRMYGLPRVVFVPGQGYGTYDWSDHTILLPAFPVESLEKSLTYALGTFRWDSDEDRILKNAYESLKANRGKTILDMAASFYKDYFLWMTKERQGYRVLPRDTHKAFAEMLAPRDSDA